MGFRIRKTLTLRWWELGIFKAGLLALGLSAGAYWHGQITPYSIVLALLASVALAYIAVAWWKQ